MKRIIIVAFALLAALALIGCKDTLSVTSPDFGDYYTQWAPERTAYPGVGPWNYVTNISFGGAPLDATSQNLLIVAFNTVPESADILKYKTLAEFGPALKAALHFYNYTDKGDAAKLIPPKLASSPLNYDVIKWEGKMATIKFTNLTTALSDWLEVRLDSDNYTHHDGQKLDLNNDGVIDNYDLLRWGRMPLAGTTNTGFDACVDYIPFYGLIDHYDRIIVSDDLAYFSIFIQNYLVVNNLDKTNYTNTFNNIFKMQKFNLDQRKWEDTNIKGTYNIADGEFRFTINKPKNFDHFRMILANYSAAMQFSTSGEFFGFKQKLFGGSDLRAPNDPVINYLTPIQDLTNYVPSNPFAVANITNDSDDRNVVVSLALDLGGAISDKGLPDPKSALEKNQILLGYSIDPLLTTIDPTDQFEWNNLIILPVTVEPYKSDPTQTVNDMWRLILPPGYERQTGPGTATKYLFITPAYKDSGAPAKMFGNPNNIMFMYEGNIQYEIYELSNTF